MSLPRFTLYFLSVSVCAVVLFPVLAPPVSPAYPMQPCSAPYSAPSFVALEMAMQADSRKALHHHRHLASATIVASN